MEWVGWKFLHEEGVIQYTVYNSREFMFEESMKKGGQKDTYRVPSGIVGAAFEVGMG